MAYNQVNVRLVTRNDSADAWKEKNPVLMLGEFGFESDTGLIKVGDDIHPWNELSYINDLTTLSATHYEGTAEQKEDGSYESDAEVISRITKEASIKTEDIFVVKRVISGEKFSYTAYIYNGTDWSALDGNYSAENVFFDEDFTITSNIGVIEIPEGENNVRIEAAGKNIKDVLTSIFSKRKYPSVVKPTVEIKLACATTVEVGTEVTPVYEAKLNPGSYTYGPETGIVASSWSITDNQEMPNTATTAYGSFPKMVVKDETNYKVTAVAHYQDGAIPVDNFGDNYPEAQIKSSSISGSNEITLKGYRNYFYGVLSTTSKEEPITGSLIRSLTKGSVGGYIAKTTFTMNASSVVDAKRMIIAYPASAVTTERTGLSSVILPNSLNFDAVASGVYTQQANIEVAGANDYVPVPYIVWVYEPDSIDSREIHNVTLA